MKKLFLIFLILQTIIDSKPKKNWWKPTAKTTWQWQLANEIDLSYDVEMYDVDLEETPQETIDLLHEKGIKVICYFNGGAYEPYRKDSSQFYKASLGKVMEGWEDEKWLDIANYKRFAHIMKARLNLAVKKKCDGVEPDNMDGYTNKTGFKLKYRHQLRYNKWMAKEAHKRGLSIALKNDLNQIKDLVNDFDFAVNEQCFHYNECDLLLPFIKKNKAVFGVEYELKPDKFCKKANKMKLSWLKMDDNLDGGRYSCQDNY
ncbi:MAG: endo alpha-1,4 polygalactosaminidase [Candidatus Cloacimonadota bacterium]|nr:MAG: endo alpha-1,4 polygalactosaminidase [Candidatus Cloacimonadota bacterium]